MGIGIRGSWKREIIGMLLDLGSIVLEADTSFDPLECESRMLSRESGMKRHPKELSVCKVSYLSYSQTAASQYVLVSCGCCNKLPPA